MSQCDTTSLIAYSDLCSGAAQSTLQALATRGHRIQLPGGRVIVDAGQADAPIHLLLTGGVRLAVPNINGNEKTIATLDPGKTIGLAEYFSGFGYRYYVQTQSPTSLLSVPGDLLIMLADNDPVLLRNMLASLGRQFDALAHDIENSNRFNAFQRVINYLLRTAVFDGQGEALVMLAHKKSVTASRLGVAPETLSRALASLSDAGHISVENRSIRLHDPEALESLLGHRIGNH